MSPCFKNLRRTVALLLITIFCTPVLQADKVRTYTTNAEGSLMLERKDFSTSISCGNNIITLCPDTVHQTMDGFGYAITYSTCYNLLKMKARDRHRFLVNTFSPTKGLDVSYIRTSIGCSDFSSTEYSLCDHPGLSNFALHDDEIHYVIPIIKEILDINPQMKIIAAPWTCPKWMKVKNLKTLERHDSWTSGHLAPDMRSTYAQYFVKFVQAFAQQGIHIHAVTPQNEPLNQGNCASLFMPWDEQAEFITHLAAAFKNAGLTTKIYCFDHNWNYDRMQEQEGYPIKVFDALTNVFEGSELVVGSAWHDYGGEASELDRINNRLPDKEVIFTEASIGTWNDGRNLQKRLLTDMNRLVYNTITKQCRAVMVWNLMLDLKRGPNLDGGCTTCYGAVDIDESDYKTIRMNSHYYVIAHSSAVVQPGAKRIGHQIKGCDGINTIAFQNPDGTMASLLINNGKTDTEVSITQRMGSVANVQVPARSVVSVLIGKPSRTKPQDTKK
ncbi:MAG: glycoside hydrolase family 30 beta sandwich domain-containing protein [Bacteroidaceae bacterium]